MRIQTILRGILCVAALCATSGAYAAANINIPFTMNDNTTGLSKGIWLADTTHLGNPPVQLTNQILDGPSQTIAVLDDWTYDAVNHQATAVHPVLIVYGVGGHLYKANLKTISPVQAFGNVGYAELCSLTALDQKPYGPSRSYVQAVVEPVGSLNTCASGNGMQTWLLPASADGTTAPTLEPAQWRVLGAFTDPANDSFVRWIVWSGNSVDAYKANFVGHVTLLVGPPAGTAPTVIARVAGTVFLASSADSAGTHTDSLYRVTMSGGTFVADYSYPDAALCATGLTTTSIVTSSMTDTATGVVIYSEPTSTGYAVFATPLAGGAPSTIYADNTNNVCGAIGGDSVSAGHVVINAFDNTLGVQAVIGVNEAGPVSQTPVAMAGDVSHNAFVHYVIDGHAWIDINDVTTPGFTEIVEDGDGTVLNTFVGARISNDIWAGYFPGGGAPLMDRASVYLFTANAGHCTGGVMQAIDPASFAATTINGVPADACRPSVYGWQPASVGGMSTGNGSVPVEVDPVAGQMYMLLGPDNTSSFINLTALPGYPFF